MIEKCLLWILKDASLTPITQKIGRVLGDPCQKPGTKNNNKYIFIISQYQRYPALEKTVELMFNYFRKYI